MLQNYYMKDQPVGQAVMCATSTVKDEKKTNEISTAKIKAKQRYHISIHRLTYTHIETE